MSLREPLMSLQQHLHFWLKSVNISQRSHATNNLTNLEPINHNKELQFKLLLTFITVETNSIVELIQDIINPILRDILSTGMTTIVLLLGFSVERVSRTLASIESLVIRSHKFT